MKWRKKKQENISRSFAGDGRIKWIQSRLICVWGIDREMVNECGRRRHLRILA